MPRGRTRGNRAREDRAAQIAAMADSDRVRLLALVMTDPSGSTTPERLAGRGDADLVRHHLEELARVGLLLVEEGHFRPSHDALVRFGGLLGPSREPGHEFGDHDRILTTIASTLQERFEGLVAAETVQELVLESYDLLASRATVRQFLPQLTERFATDRLEALASLDAAGNRMADDVLFVCVRNAGRSQIAAAFMRDRVGDVVRIRTAGSAPDVRLDPVVQEELGRRGIDTLTEFPRPLTSEVVRASGVVVTMGCGDACPVVPGRRYVDWSIDDPVGRSAQEVRRIVEDISVRVDRLIDEMGVAAG